jgi:hypothetical protein
MRPLSGGKRLVDVGISRFMPSNRMLSPGRGRRKWGRRHAGGKSHHARWAQEAVAGATSGIKPKSATKNRYAPNRSGQSDTDLSTHDAYNCPVRRCDLHCRLSQNAGTPRVYGGHLRFSAGRHFTRRLNASHGLRLTFPLAKTAGHEPVVEKKLLQEAICTQESWRR